MERTLFTLINITNKKSTQPNATTKLTTKRTDRHTHSLREREREKARSKNRNLNPSLRQTEVTIHSKFRGAMRTTQQIQPGSPYV